MRKLSDEYLGGFFDADGSAQLNAFLNKSGRKVIQFMPMIRFIQHKEDVIRDIHYSLGFGTTTETTVNITKISDVKIMVDRFMDKVVYKRPQLEIIRRYVYEIPHKRGIAWSIESKRLALDLVFQMRELNKNHKCPYRYSNEELLAGLEARIERAKHGKAYIGQTNK